MSGAERSLLALLEGLDGKVGRMVACPDGELSEALRRAGVNPEPIRGTEASFKLHPVHTPHGVFEMMHSSIQVRRLAKRLSPDLIHANTTRAALLSLLARERAGPPVIAHVRDWVPEGRSSRAVLRLIAHQADAVVANSAYVAGQFEGLPVRRPVTVIHNPVDLERFDLDSANGLSVRRELGIDSKALVVATVAQFTPWKGQDDAIRMVAGLPRHDREVILLLVGSAKFVAAGTRFDNVAFERGLHELAAGLGVSERVRFAGERRDIPDVLAATDVLVVPSWREAFGRIAIEGMAMGVPVLATEAGGPAEIVRDGVDGMLLPPREPEAWTRALEPLLRNAAKRLELGRAGRARAMEFSVERHVAAILALYEEVMSSERPPIVR